ncbi:MAG TPA: hypothetical protein VFA04_05905, partial [Bryobacteraceae bacterium]|nr:hypothetical protein [Bryobacteraceae bacterium]
HSLTERMPGSEHAEDAGYFAAPRGYSASEDRMARFFSLARDGKSGIDDSKSALRAARAALLANESYFQGRSLEISDLVA